MKKQTVAMLFSNIQIYLNICGTVGQCLAVRFVARGGSFTAQQVIITVDEIRMYSAHTHTHALTATQRERRARPSFTS